MLPLKLLLNLGEHVFSVNEVVIFLEGHGEERFQCSSRIAVLQDLKICHHVNGQRQLEIAAL